MNRAFFDMLLVAGAYIIAIVLAIQGNWVEGLLWFLFGDSVIIKTRIDEIFKKMENKE
jgi:hypothetical protein